MFLILSFVVLHKSDMLKLKLQMSLFILIKKSCGTSKALSQKKGTEAGIYFGDNQFPANRLMGCMTECEEGAEGPVLVTQHMGAVLVLGVCPSLSDSAGEQAQGSGGLSWNTPV